jgi:NADH-quinone oxidoreductase subunit M
MPALSILVWLPLACGLLGALVPVRDRRFPGALAFLGSLAALALSIGYLADFKSGTAGLQHVTDVVWISELGIHYKLGIDGLNVFLLVLTTLLFAAATLASNLRTSNEEAFSDSGTSRAGSSDADASDADAARAGSSERVQPERPRLFYFHFMLAESAVLGAFLAQDLALFVAFFDLMLIPFYFLIGGWGREPGRVKATIKLVIYTLAGSLLMLAAAIATGVLASQQGGGHITFVLSSLQAMPLSRGSQEWIFLFFAAAFLVKMPAFPLHGWMPDGYRAMPIEVLMVFSGVLSKVGAYGFLRIVLPLYPQAAAHFQILMLLIGLASIVYGSVVAFTQTDARLIVGYSSVAQMGFITLGIFALNPQGAQGALLQMTNHGLVVAAILFIVALLARRAGGSEDLREMGGIAFRAPVLASLFLIVALATLAMPGSSNFVGEFLILLGVFKTKLAISVIAFAGVVMASVYALRMFIRAMHNRTGAHVDSREISLLDSAVLVPLVAVILFLALYPQLALHRSERSVKVAVAPAQVALLRPRLSAALETQPGLAAPTARRQIQEYAGSAEQ